MILTTTYPTVKEIVLKMKELEPIADNWTDETIYDAIGEWDLKFANDPAWFDEDDTDEKDSLRDQVEVYLGWEV